MPSNQSNGNESVPHADIEVMKSQIITINEAVQGVAAKMDVIVGMQITMTQTQERQDAQRMALDRAFTAIAEAKAKADNVANEQSRMMSFVKGGATVGVLLFALTQWYTLQQINKLEETSKALSAVDRRLMFIESKFYKNSPPPEIPAP